MKTSRNDGVLVFDVRKNYKVSVNGEYEFRKQIICHDVNRNCESAALDLEQLLLVALNNLPEQKEASKKQIESGKSDEKKTDDFFKKDSPTLEEVKEQATALEMAVMINNSVKASKILECFNDFIISGAICTEGDVNMTIPVWQTLAMTDKVYIVYMYSSFFVNPLVRLSNMESSTENQG